MVIRHPVGSPIIDINKVMQQPQISEDIPVNCDLSNEVSYTKKAKRCNRSGAARRRKKRLAAAMTVDGTSASNNEHFPRSFSASESSTSRRVYSTGAEIPGHSYLEKSQMHPQLSTGFKPFQDPSTLGQSWGASSSYPKTLGEDWSYNISKKLKDSSEPKSAFPTKNQHSLRVAIINNNHPLGHIPEDKEPHIKTLLQIELDKLILSSKHNSDAVPAFKSWKYSEKVINITCLDDHTRIWLTKTVANIKPWNNASLSIVSSDNLPKLTKATLFIPNDVMVCGIEEKNVVLRRLAQQNPEVSVQKWRLFRYKELPSGQMFVFGIGDRDIKILIDKLLEIFYLFRSLYLKVNLSNLVAQVVDDVLTKANDERSSDSEC
ncbi:unnamed protein product [Acanthoscelides obtectus]|uniref:DUF4780 domain-containing protein n=1 Tax=Acanthoscelides obtectus TaxID=200917 RepID=A0A9P0LA01_ACAOB|nr:unnamed protein product [Acanthoscelides obtectus]CAK1659799.1 hypothetical protein AOBTE_LOCUS21681 [Acanthoscelides obtectus]